MVTLVAGKAQSAGQHLVVWDGRGLASGIYTYRLEAGDYVDSRRMMLIR